MPSTEPVPVAVLRSLVDAVDEALWAGGPTTPPPVEPVPPQPSAPAGVPAGAGPTTDHPTSRCTPSDRVPGGDDRPGEAGPPGPVLLRIVAVRGGGGGDGSRGGDGGPPTGSGRSVPLGSAELGILPLGGGHPLDALLGFVAPPAWAALGVAAPGDGRVLDGDRPPERVWVTMLLARSGAAASVLRRDGRPPARLDEPPQGAVADACRRALGLPTAPPPSGTAQLWTRWWLDRVVQAATERGAPGPVPGWAEAVALHPAAFVPFPARATASGAGDAPSHDPDGADEPGPATEAAGAGSVLAPEPAVAAATTRALADAWTWSRLRAEPSVVADLAGPPVSRRVAQWMDDGMFARWLLSALPPTDALLDACRALLPDGVADRVAAVTAVALGPPEGDR